ncbi:MAG TPA: hypothetical protein VHC98_00910 [Candidatus Saccharimonadales bacterium]|nr:hypothetical protein [Candidatus Saccharimonadales bacterium]
MSVSARRLPFLLVGALLAIGLISMVLPANEALAADLTSRSLTLQAGATDGGSQPGGVVNHLFSFTIPTAGAISSIKFQYCTTADIDIGGACTTPHGLVTTSATLGTQTGVSFTSLVNTTNGAPYLTAVSPITIVTSGGSANNVVSFQVRSVTNQDVNAANCGGAANCTFYVRISTYSSTDATGTPVDSGTVAASTSTQIVLSGTMPESLIFCAGHTISVNGGGVPDCSTATSGSINFNQLFSPTDTAYATSQMAASTNATSGYVITVTGPTLTSGSNTIPAVGGTAAASATGTGQFGLNLAADTAVPTSGANQVTPASATVAPAPNASNYRGTPAATGGSAPYSTNFATGGNAATALFAFTASTPNVVAASDFNNSLGYGDGTGHPTDAQIFTATYMVNVSGSQPAGTYTSTLTYICTPTF